MRGLDAGPASATLRNLWNVIVRPFAGPAELLEGALRSEERCRYHSIHSVYSGGQKCHQSATRTKQANEQLFAFAFKLLILL